ncbi:MAG TPA: TetR/AcrR family transcriptional regulator C-terminal domain-containing protein [Candidatus Cottocaccamicrobium excrementipullorum]|nr:TetR/AcrR family transcriptional regulator C-terminal domain-containing protein [Candidatus Cottocaccamicrobium excrementipullorum]
MADSNLTKRALASALKELMKEEPFDKIQVAQICERCSMNRKSFYYHFKDKYDLLNWIFDTEIISFYRNFSGTETLDQHLEMFREICDYFYVNKDFYYSAFKIHGQNSFSEHFREYMKPFLKLRLAYLIGEDAEDDFVLDFFSDAIACTLKRWLLKKDCMSSNELVSRLTKIVLKSADAVHKELKRAK